MNQQDFIAGLLYPLAQYGIFGLVYYYALYKSILHLDNYKGENKISQVAFAVFILMTLLTEPQADEPIILCFIFDGIIRWIKNEKKRSI